MRTYPVTPRSASCHAPCPGDAAGKGRGHGAVRTLTPGPQGCEDSDPGAAEVEGSAYAACSASDGEPCLVSADSPYLLTAKPSQGPVF